MDTRGITLVVASVLIVIALVIVLVVSLTTPSTSVTTVNASPDVVLSYNAFKQTYTSPPTCTTRIPKLMVRTSHNKYTSMVEPLYNVIKTTKEKHPDYTIVYLEDDDCIDFIKEYYPEHLAGYMSLVPGAYKADIFRILFLYTYGGFYNDCSQSYYVPCEDFLDFDTHRVVLVNDRYSEGIYNAFIASTAGHPLIKQMIDTVMSSVNTKDYGRGPLDITGPNACMRAFNTYYHMPQTFRLTGEYFYPDGSIKVLHHISDECGTIVDTNKRKIIKNKFPNYQKIMYSNFKKIHYGDLWNTHAVYNV